MKILVFDDNETHRNAAKSQLGSVHDLTVVGTYDEAQKLLTPTVDKGRRVEMFKNKYGDEDYAKSDGFSKEQQHERFEYWHGEASKLATVYPEFDVILTDLLVPASGQAQGQSSIELVGKEMPVGIFIGLLAAVKGRAKYVAVFTDSSHHAHPASACFDIFNEREPKPTPFMVEESKVLLSNTRSWVSTFDPNDLSKELKYEEYSKRPDTVRAKNWAALLDYLLKA